LFSFVVVCYSEVLEMDEGKGKKEGEEGLHLLGMG
jgi:hypothetical protein